MKVAVIGAGWAGCAAAVEATRLGQQVTVFEAARIPGRRARRVDGQWPDGTALALHNGQHILIGAYSETLRLMADVGIAADTALLRLPLTLQFPDGTGLAFPRLPAPLDALAGIVRARGWSWRDKLSLLRAAVDWQISGFRCAPELSVAQLCRTLPGLLALRFRESVWSDEAVGRRHWFGAWGLSSLGLIVSILSAYEVIAT